MVSRTENRVLRSRVTHERTRCSCQKSVEGEDPPTHQISEFQDYKNSLAALLFLWLLAEDSSSLPCNKKGDDPRAAGPGNATCTVKFTHCPQGERRRKRGTSCEQRHPRTGRARISKCTSVMRILLRSNLQSASTSAFRLWVPQLQRSRVLFFSEQGF